MTVMLFCGSSQLEAELGALPIEITDRYSARGGDEARVLAIAARPDLVLVERDLAGAEELVGTLRTDPATRSISIAIVASGDFSHKDMALLEAGANAVLRLPVDPEWALRLRSLVERPRRVRARWAVSLFPSGAGSEPAPALSHDLSVAGMLVETHADLMLGAELPFTLQPRGTPPISGHARVQRRASEHRYGLEFLGLDQDGSSRLQGLVAGHAP